MYAALVGTTKVAVGFSLGAWVGYELGLRAGRAGVARTADEQVRVHFKKPNRYGATYAQMSPHTFLARLCALVPPPRAHTVVYYSVLSARHALRSAVVSDRLSRTPSLRRPLPQSTAGPAA